MFGTKTLFGKSKHPKEIITTLHENLLIMDNNQRSEKEKKRASEEITRSLNVLKELVTDKSEGRPPKEKDTDLAASEKTRINEVIAEVAAEMIDLHTIPLLISQLDKIDFESSKYVVDLFSHVMHRKVGVIAPAVQYFMQHKDILYTLLRGYVKSENAIQYGAMLRDACRHESLAKELLNSQAFYDLFTYVQGTAFDVSSDAFSTLKDLLTRHKPVVAEYLDKNYDVFFDHYQKIIVSENYVTKRQALKLLGELLLDRYNFTIMTKYISNVDNLKMIMNILKSREKQIAFEAFHCFKVFVANPNKLRPVHNILYQNQEKLTEFLTSFQTERSEDVQFNEEKQYLIKQIRDLKPPPASNTNAAASGPMATPAGASETAQH